MSACEKEDNTNKEIIFEGITWTSYIGETIIRDTTDWRFTDDWNDKENSLFGESTLLCNSNGYDYSIFSYPNPCSHSTSIDLRKPDEMRFIYCFVDRYYNVLFSDTTYSSRLNFNMDIFNISNDTIRMYYKLLGDNCELRGHGDIKIESK